MAALNHLTHGATDHHAVERLGQGVTLGVVHAASHVRVQAHEGMLDQDLFVLQCRRVQGDQFEIVRGGLTAGAADQMDLRVLGHECLLVFIRR